MVYKKYIKRNGKTFGPYYYESIKKKGKVTTRYHGTSHPNKIKKEKEIIKNISNKNLIYFGVVVLLIVAFLNLVFVLDLLPTGRISASIDSTTELGEVVKLTMKQGELIPADTKIIVDNVGDIQEFFLRDLLSEEIVEGNFFMRGKDVSGVGQGFGFFGEKQIYPDVEFVLGIKEKEISVSSEGGGTGGGAEVDVEVVVEDEPSIEEEIPTGEESIEGEVSTEETPVEESGTEEIIDSTPEIEDSGTEESTIETPSEETSTESFIESSSDSISDSISSAFSSDTGSSDAGSDFGGDSGGDSGGSPITGEVVGESEYLEEIQGVVSYENDFSYSFLEGQTAEIISSKQDVNLNINENVVTISTDYFEIEQGFGEDYVTEEDIRLSFPLSKLNLEEKPGILRISFVYGEEELVSTSKVIGAEEEIIEKPIINITEFICGNNFIEINEECDDGNLIDGDGCSSECVLEQILENLTKRQRIDDFLESKEFKIEQKVIDDLIDKPKVRVIIKTKQGKKSIGKKLSNLENLEVVELNELNLALLDDLEVEEIILDQPMSLLLTDSENIIGSLAVRNEFGLTGKNQKICVIDTGVDYNHEDILNYIEGYDFVNNDNDVLDDNGHGTSVAGIISTIASDSDLIVAKVIDENGIGYESYVLQGLQWCIDQGSDIISFSIGSGDYPGYCDTNIVAELVNRASAQGIFVVAATGNDGSDNLKSPACAVTATRVSSTTKSDEIVSFANVNNMVDVFAPGENILTSKLGGGSVTLSGTSASAPMVAGAAALILENENLIPEDLKYRFASTGKSIAFENINISRLDVYNAVINNLTTIPFGYESNETVSNETNYFLLGGVGAKCDGSSGPYFLCDSGLACCTSGFNCIINKVYSSTRNCTDPDDDINVCASRICFNIGILGANVCASDHFNDSATEWFYDQKKCCGDDFEESFCGTNYESCYLGERFDEGDDNDYTCNCGEGEWFDSSEGAFFGHNSIEDGFHGWGHYTSWVPYTTPDGEGIVLDSIFIYANTSYSGVEMYAAIYSDSSGSIGSLLAENMTGVNVVEDAASQWYKIKIPGEISLSPNTQYWLAQGNNQDSGSKLFIIEDKETSGPGAKWNATGPITSFPNEVGTLGSSYKHSMSIYATYSNISGQCCGDDGTSDDWHSGNSSFGCCCDGNRIGESVNEFCTSKGDWCANNDGLYCSQNSILFEGNTTRANLVCGGVCGVAQTSSNYICDSDSDGDIEGICGCTTAACPSATCIGPEAAFLSGSGFMAPSSIGASAQPCDTYLDDGFNWSSPSTGVTVSSASGYICAQNEVCISSGTTYQDGCLRCDLTYADTNGDPCDSDVTNAIYNTEGICGYNLSNNADCIVGKILRVDLSDGNKYKEGCDSSADKCDKNSNNGIFSIEGLCASNDCDSGLICYNTSSTSYENTCNSCIQNSACDLDASDGIFDGTYFCSVNGTGLINSKCCVNSDNCVHNDVCYAENEVYNVEPYDQICLDGQWQNRSYVNLCNPNSPSADLIINSNLVCFNDIHIANLNITSTGFLTLEGGSLIVGNTTIESGGKLLIKNSQNTIWQNSPLIIAGDYVLENSKLRMNGTYDGNVGINVTSTGSMIINDSSNITNGYLVSANYYFNIYNGAQFNMNGSYLSFAGWADNIGSRGLESNASSHGDFVIKNSIFKNNYNAITILGKNSLVENNTFEDNINRAILIEESSENQILSNFMEVLGVETKGVFITENSFSNFIESNIIELFGATSSQGIRIQESYNNFIFNNNVSVISSNHVAILVELNSFDNKIYDNLISSSNRGIFLKDCSNNSVYNNKLIITSSSIDGAIAIARSINNSIYSNQINTSANNAIGIKLYENMQKNLIYNNEIYTQGQGSHGFFFGGNFTENLIFDNNVSTSGIDAYAVKLEHNVSYNTFFRNNWNNSNSRSNAIYLDGISLENYDNVFSNLFINDTIVDKSFGSFYGRNGAYDNIFRNVSFNESKISFAPGFMDNLEIQWFVRANVMDYNTNPILGSSVEISDKNNFLVASDDTDSNGLTELMIVTDKIINKVGKILKNNHTINVSKQGYGEKLFSVNVSESKYLDFYLNAKPIIQDLVLNSTSGFNVSVDNLSVYFKGYDLNGDSFTNITDWRFEEESIAVLNMPFDTQGIEPTPSDWLGIDSSYLASYDDYCGNITPTYNLSAALDGIWIWWHGPHSTGNYHHWFILDLGENYNVFEMRGRSADTGDPTSVDLYVGDTKGNWGTPVKTNVDFKNVIPGNWVNVDTIDKVGRYILVNITNTESATGAVTWGDWDQTPSYTGNTYPIFDVYGQIINPTIEKHIRDYSTFENNGTLGGGTIDNAPTWISNGQIGGAYNFDGNDYINISEDFSLNLTDQITIEAWINPNINHEITTENYGVLSKALNPVWSWQLRFGGVSEEGPSDRLGFQFNEDGTIPGVWVNIDQNLLVGNWYYLVGTYDGINAKIYLNGVLKDTASLNGIRGPFAPILIGQDGWDNYFNGKIDEVKIYNRSLSAEQIQVNYLAGLAGHQFVELVSQETNIGDNWGVAVTPNDGFEDGETVLSNELEIINAVPVIQSINLLPTMPYTKHYLNCRFNITDFDNPVLNVNVEWYKDDVNFLNQTVIDYSQGTFYDSNLSFKDTNHDNKFYCRINATDGIVSTGWSSNTQIRTIQNYSTDLGVYNESGKAIEEQVTFTANYYENDPNVDIGDLKRIIYEGGDFDINDNLAAMKFYDYDGDGREDSFVYGNHTGSEEGHFYLTNTNGNILWTSNMGNNLQKAIRIADVDADGEDEIIGVSHYRSFVSIINKNGNEENSFEIPSSNGWVLEIANLNDDPYLELIVGSSSMKGILAYNYAGDLIWENNNFTNSKWEIVLLDSNEDGVIDYMASSDDSSPDMFFILNASNGDIIWNQSFGGGRARAMTFEEVSGEGIKELIVHFSASGSALVGFDVLTGANVWTSSLTNDWDSLSFDLVSLDINADGDKDFIIQDHDDQLRARDNDGSVIWTETITDISSYKNVFLSDIDDNEDEELIAGASKSILSVYNPNSTGSNLDFEINLSSGQIGADYGRSEAIDSKDINGDGVNDIGVATRDGYIYLLQDVNCRIEFNDSVSSEMIWNKTTELFEYNRSFVTGGNYSYNVTCEKGGYRTKLFESSLYIIPNTLPTVVLDFPEDNADIINRFSEFNWTGSDNQNDDLTYELNITCYSSLGGLCSNDHRLIKLYTPVAPGQESYTLLDSLNHFDDNSYYYLWSVRANDSFGWGEWASPHKLNISSVVSIGLTTDYITFGEMDSGTSDNTEDDSPGPFILENDGNCFVDVNVSATQLWNIESSNSALFQFKADKIAAEKGNAIDLDGNLEVSPMDYVNIGNDLSLNSTNFTISFWINRKDIVANGWEYPFNKRGGGFGWYAMINAYANYDPPLYIFEVDPESKYVSTRITNNQWHHVVNVYNGSDLKLYLDGSLVDSKNGVYISYNASLPLFIGTRRDNTNFNLPTTVQNQYFKGKIDEVAYWNQSLSANDILDLYKSGVGMYINPDLNWPTDGGLIGEDLVGLWHIDEGSGTIMGDSSGSPVNNGNIIGMESGDWVTGKIDLGEGSFDAENSQMGWMNMSISPGESEVDILKLFNWQDDLDEAEIDLFVQVPTIASGEGAGTRTSTITFRARLGE